MAGVVWMHGMATRVSVGALVLVGGGGGGVVLAVGIQTGTNPENLGCCCLGCWNCLFFVQRMEVLGVGEGVAATFVLVVVVAAVQLELSLVGSVTARLLLLPTFVEVRQLWYRRTAVHVGWANCVYWANFDPLRYDPWTPWSVSLI